MDVDGLGAELGADDAGPQGDMGVLRGPRPAGRASTSISTSPTPSPCMSASTLTQPRTGSVLVPGMHTKWLAQHGSMAAPGSATTTPIDSSEFAESTGDADPVRHRHRQPRRLRAAYQ